MSRLLRTSSIFAAILLMLLGSLVVLFPQKALAANETYRWTSNTTVVANGGDLQGDTTFTANAPALPSLFATMTYRTGCQFKVQMSVLANNASGRLTLPQSAGGPGDGITNRCSVEIAQTYNNQVVTLQGTRPGPGDAPETQLQKHISVMLYSPSAAAQSPQSVTFVWRNAAGATVATTTSPQHSDTAGNSNDPNLQVVRYETGTDLDPGTYSVCPSAIVGCQNFTKVKYQGLSLTYGESLSARNIDVTLQLSVTRPDKDPYAVGPIELSLQLADGTGPVVKTQTDRFSTPGVPGSAATSQSTISLRGTFTNVDAGTYKVCTVVSNVCQNVTKDTNRDAEVTLTESLAPPPAAGTTDTCATQSGALGWLTCPVISWAAEAAESLSVLIVNLLKLDTDTLFNSSNDPSKQATSAAFHSAWAGFRNIAYGILVIIGLIMIASQIFNIEIFNAYTLRKMLPGIIIAIIFVTLSWDLMEFLYNMSNAAADAVMEIIKLPFQQVEAVRDKDIGTVIGGLLQLILFGGAAAGAVVAYAALGGPAVVLALVASVALSVFSVFLLLAARNVVAYFLVIVAPVPIMMAAFEPLKKGFSFWKGLVVVIVITVPGVAGILAVTTVGSAIAAAAAQSQTGLDSAFSYISAFVIVVAGVAMTWTLFLQMDKITGFLGNVANKATGKAREGLKNFRGNTMKRRTGEVLSGQRDWGAVGKTMRYASLSGKPGMGGNVFTKKGWQNRMQKLAYAENAMMGKTGSELLKNEDGSVSGNDDGMAVVTQGVKDDGDYDNKYVARKRAQHERKNPGIAWTNEMEAEARTEAQDTRREIVARMGSAINSRATRRAAAHARWTSVSAYNDWDLDTEAGQRGMRTEMAEEIGAMMNEGGMTMTEVAATLKKNSQRTDISGHSFPQIMFQAKEIAERYKARKEGKTVTKGRKMSESGDVVRDTTGKALEDDLYLIDRVTGQQATVDKATGVATIVDKSGKTVTIDAGRVETALMTAGEMETWDLRSIEYVNAGQDMGQRTESVKVHASVARRRIQKQFRKFNKELLEARKGSAAAEKQFGDLRQPLELAVAEEQRALSGAFPPDMDSAQIEAVQRGAQEKVRSIREQMAKAQAEKAKHDAAADQIQVELVRQVATVMGKQTVMGSYSSPENQRVFYEGVLSQPVDPTNPNGKTIMQYGEELRESSEVFRNFERSYTQRATAGAAAALAASTAAGAAAGPGAGMPPPGRI